VFSWYPVQVSVKLLSTITGFCRFSQYIQANCDVYLQAGNDHFLQNPYLLTIHEHFPISFDSSYLCSLNSIIWCTNNQSAYLMIAFRHSWERICVHYYHYFRSRKPKINDRGNPLLWPRDTLYPQKLALTSPTSGGLSVGIVRSRTKATEFS
jgi:hypothetical protein